MSIENLFDFIFVENRTFYMLIRKEFIDSTFSILL